MLRSAIGLILSIEEGPFLGIAAIRAFSRSSGIPSVHQAFISSRSSSVLVKSSHRSISVVMWSVPGVFPDFLVCQWLR